ncbi:MAG: hypothetical protein JNM84_05425 [Planctomycetes bacterium]|nr:hypothetical protein [Planctomycetota bacterium]
MPGISLLLTVPPDLPVFLELAVELCRRQDPRHLVEGLVIPDQRTREFRALFEQVRSRWPELPLRLVEPGPIARGLRPWLRVGSVIHWLQLVAGVNAARGSHVLLHDVDLFVRERGLFTRLYERCRDEQLACAGIARPSADAEWQGAASCAHLVAVRDVLFAQSWLREQSPNALRPQLGQVPEGRFWFETSLLAQARCAPERIGGPEPLEQVHFEYVIGTYRKFQRTRGPYEDANFRLLLIRLFIEAFARLPWNYELPTLEELARGLEDPRQRVFYGARARQGYERFRAELAPLLSSAHGFVDERAATTLRTALQPFDAAFLASCASPHLQRARA